ncbi:hypothetical protein KUV28_21535 [Ferrimonas balearica]|nr:hypothetical protein [Ferrimonas balearica]
MSTRNTYTGDSEQVPWADAGPTEGFGNQYARLMRTLFDASALSLTVPAGVNDITATVDPELPSGGLVTGMKFSITWPSTNTGPMSLALNGAAAVPVVTAGGEAMTPGTAEAGTRAMLEYVGTDFRVLITGAMGGGGAGEVSGAEIFTSSGTWTKSANATGNETVLVQMWGGGGGGDNSDNDGGGGGGEFAQMFFRMSDLPATVSVIVGAGGTPQVSGGSSSFGALLNAEGGGGGGSGRGGAGGGDSFGLQSDWRGGRGVPPLGVTEDESKDAIWGGGGGGYWGNYNIRGLSKFGGDGGAGGTSTRDGSIPGGGGGTNGGNGARGEVRVFVF